MKKYIRIKKNSKVTYQWNGMLYTSKYVGRQKHKPKNEWIYLFKDANGGLNPFFANDITVVFYGAE